MKSGKLLRKDHITHIKLGFVINIDYLKLENPPAKLSEWVGLYTPWVKLKENLINRVTGLWKLQPELPFEAHTFLFDGAFIEDEATPMGLGMEVEDTVEVFGNANKALVEVTLLL